MKVDLIIARRREWRHSRAYYSDIVRCLPFFLSRMASRAHRVRSGLHFDSGRLTHASYSLWCGQTGLIDDWPKHRGNALHADPPARVPVCATCEGRAIGAGQLPSHKIAGRFVLFTPRI